MLKMVHPHNQSQKVLHNHYLFVVSFDFGRPGGFVLLFAFAPWLWTQSRHTDVSSILLGFPDQFIGLSWTFSFISWFKLEYGCFTKLCWSLLYNTVNQLYVYIHPLLGPPSYIPIPLITEHWAELPALYNSFPLLLLLLLLSRFSCVQLCATP